ncbi:DUF2304 domain-containing protein [Candidatus Peribacteria bacterium]|nr:DUF2304 domain-containing protein [Candidatus Peribacteria bacterium]
MMPTEFTPYQVVVPLFGGLMIVYAWNLVLRQKKTVWEGILWTVFWSSVAYISLVPSSLQTLSTITGIKKNENAATITAIGVIFFILFYLIMRLEELEQRVVKVVRERTLKDAGIMADDNRSEKN